MKNVSLLLLFSLLFTLVNSQEKIITTENGSKIILEDSIHFRFHENCGGCPVGCKYGNGQYLIQKNKIELQFQKKPIDKTHCEIQYDSIDNDSIFTIQVQVFEDSIHGLIGANVFYFMGEFINGTSTDYNGKAKLNFKKNVKYDSLYVKFIGYSDVIIPITNRNQSIKIYLDTITFWKIYDIKKVYRLNKWRNYWEEINKN